MNLENKDGKYFNTPQQLKKIMTKLNRCRKSFKY